MSRALFFIITIMFGLLSVNIGFAKQIAVTDNETISSVVIKEDYSPQLIEKIKVERNSIYNALNLTPEQINKKTILEEKRYNELQPKLKQYCIAKKNINSKIKQTDNQIYKNNQRELDTIKNDIKKISSKYDREFKKILTSEQKSKYNMIVKLRRAELKTLGQKQRAGALRPFGVPITQAEYTQKQKEKFHLKNLFRSGKNIE